jgi:hypothetical protein
MKPRRRVIASVTKPMAENYAKKDFAEAMNPDITDAQFEEALEKLEKHLRSHRQGARILKGLE